MPRSRSSAITPSAARLTESLRDIGYDFPAAVADIVDNSIMAGAARVEIAIEFDGTDSSVSVADDGRGMTANGLVEALRYGTRRSYPRGDLGRYGLGLKTASVSQCRSVTVVTRSSLNTALVSARTLDLDLIAEWDEWLVVDPGNDQWVQRARDWLAAETGTVVIWRKLDRVSAGEPSGRRVGPAAPRSHGSEDRGASRNRIPPLPREQRRPRAGDNRQRAESRAMESFRAWRADPDRTAAAAL